MSFWQHDGEMLQTYGVCTRGDRDRIQLEALKQVPHTGQSCGSYDLAFSRSQSFSFVFPILVLSADFQFCLCDIGLARSSVTLQPNFYRNFTRFIDNTTVVSEEHNL